MSIIIPIVISVLALLTTFWQAYLQRIHNEKSVKPYGQIYLWDYDKTIAVRVINNGLGPLIIDRMIFSKNNAIHSTILDCVDLPVRSFMHFSSNDMVERVVRPNSDLAIFEATLKEGESDADLDQVRGQLAPITLKVECRDIYDNKITLERDFQWFTRHMAERNQTSL